MKGGGGYFMTAFSKLASEAAVPARCAAPFGVRVAIKRALDELEPVWRNLERTGAATVFQSFDTFSDWTRHIAPARGGDWFVIVVTAPADGQTLMLLPLVVCSQGPLTAIEAADLNVCDFNAPVIARNFQPSRDEMRAIWDAVLRMLPPADIIRLTKVPATIGAYPNPLLLLSKVHKIKLSNFKTPLFSGGEPWPAERLTSKFRSDLAARRRKLDKRGKVAFVTAETPEQIERFFDAMVEQRRVRCAAMGRENILDCPSHRTFYRALLNPGGAGCIQALLCGDEIIATGYGLVSREGFHMIFPTFKADGWRNYSPGVQLFIESMTWATGKGIAFYDFTIGGEEFKTTLGAEEYPLYEYLDALSMRGHPALFQGRLRRFAGTHPRISELIKRARSLHLWVPGSKAAR